MHAVHEPKRHVSILEKPKGGTEHGLVFVSLVHHHLVEPARQVHG